MEILRRYNLEIALVNRREKTPIPCCEGSATTTTTSSARPLTQPGFNRMGVDLMDAFEALAPNLKIVRLKNIKSTEEATTCLYSKGCIPLEDCVAKLKEIKFNGIPIHRALSV